MGKQVRFFMTYEDEKNFLASISRPGHVKLLQRYFADPLEREIESLRPIGNLKGDADLCLVNTTVEVRLKVNSYPEQSRHIIDLAESEAVEFSRCAPFKNWLNDGRLWFDEHTSHGKKSTAFLKWANSLLKWIRSHYEKDDSGLYFIAPDALALSEAGKLQLGPPTEPELSLEERRRILGLQP